MSHITLPCILSVKIDFSLDSDSKYHEDQEKKGLHLLVEKMSKMAKSKMAGNVYKINIFTNYFATTYARDINNMSILMFSGLRKPIISFVFRKNIVKSIFMKMKAKTTGYRGETLVNIVLADSFFSVLIMLG